MKSILYVYHVSSVGGGSYCLLNILKEVDRTKYKPMVLLRENGPLVNEIQKLGIEVHFFPEMTLSLYNDSLFSISSLRHEIRLKCSKGKFFGILEQLKPDIVYLNSMMLNPYLQVVKLNNISSIIHIREHWPEGEHKWQRNKAINNVLAYADQIVAINSYSASMYSKSKLPVTIVYDWIDMSSRYEERPFDKIFGGGSSKLKVYLFTGGLQEIKGTYEIIRTFIQEMKGDDNRLLLMGFSPNTKTVGFRGLVKSILRKFGYYSYSDRIYSMIKSDSRIKCIPSTYQITHIIEQSYCVLSYFMIPHANLALAESVIVNTPSIAARTEESIEYSYKGTLASLYEINNIDDFKKTIKELPSIYETLKTKLKKDSHKIESLFDRERNAKVLDSVYSKFN